VTAPAGPGRAPGRLVRSPAAAAAGLLVVTAIWGATFVVVKHAIARMDVGGFLAWRFTIAALAMLALRPRAATRLARPGRRRGVVLGAVLAAGYLTQTFGLRSTPASLSGFVTGMFVVFTPLMSGLLLRHRVGPVAWLAVAIATGGLALLALRGVAVSGGELLTLGCALAFAVHIVGLGEWSAGRNAAGLATVQLGTVAVICTAVALAVGGPNSLVPPADPGVCGALALTALAGTALAFLVQTWAQALLPPTRAAVIMTMEPVFAGLFGVVVGGDRLDGRAWAGGALVLVAMLLVAAAPRRCAAPLGGVERLEN
jgi:drug/metabolite transporter (DMT)-like permease